MRIYTNYTSYFDLEGRVIVLFNDQDKISAEHLEKANKEEAKVLWERLRDRMSNVGEVITYKGTNCFSVSYKDIWEFEMELRKFHAVNEIHMHNGLDAKGNAILNSILDKEEQKEEQKVQVKVKKPRAKKAVKKEKEHSN